MNDIPHIHLCVVQPAGYLHSLGFLDQARYFRHQFRRMGAQVSLAKNRLRPPSSRLSRRNSDAVNTPKKGSFSPISAQSRSVSRGTTALIRRRRLSQ